MKTLLANRVKEAAAAAKDKGMPVSAIAKACNSISPQAVYQWLDGSTKSIDGANLVELAEISGFNARWIATGKGPKGGISDTEKLLIRAFPLLGPDLQQSWIDAANRAMAKAEKKNAA